MQTRKKQLQIRIIQHIQLQLQVLPQPRLTTHLSLRRPKVKVVLWCHTSSYGYVYHIFIYVNRVQSQGRVRLPWRSLPPPTLTLRLTPKVMVFLGCEHILTLTYLIFIFRETSWRSWEECSFHGCDTHRSSLHRSSTKWEEKRQGCFLFHHQHIYSYKSDIYIQLNTLKSWNRVVSQFKCQPQVIQLLQLFHKVCIMAIPVKLLTGPEIKCKT